MSDFVIALAGNPNAGKSTVFNALTGSKQHVGNWPGKTVEKKEGTFSVDGMEFRLVDLPGTYSLSAFSPEEKIARDYIVQKKPALVINVVDAANLERNLYLTTQILETGAPILIVLNMIDTAKSHGIQIDSALMSKLLGDIPIVTMIARQEEGIDVLKATIVACATKLQQ